jgi:hypothetical protein
LLYADNKEANSLRETMYLFLKASAGSHYKSFDSLREASLFAVKKKYQKVIFESSLSLHRVLRIHFSS